MAELSTLARPYAKAAFEYAKEAGAVSQWQEFLAFAGSLVQDDEFATWLARPQHTAEQKLQAVYTVANDSFSDKFKNFLAQLAHYDRLPLLSEINEEFELLKSAADQELTAHVETAYDLTDAERAALQAGLEKRFGNKVVMDVSVKPELLAGATIRIGDQVIEDSALSKLKQMKANLTA